MNCMPFPIHPNIGDKSIRPVNKYPGNNSFIPQNSSFLNRQSLTIDLVRVLSIILVNSSGKYPIQLDFPGNPSACRIFTLFFLQKYFKNNHSLMLHKFKKSFFLPRKWPKFLICDVVDNHWNDFTGLLYYVYNQSFMAIK